MKHFTNEFDFVRNNIRVSLDRVSMKQPHNRIMIAVSSLVCDFSHPSILCQRIITKFILAKILFTEWLTAFPFFIPLYTFVCESPFCINNQSILTRLPISVMESGQIMTHKFYLHLRLAQHAIQMINSIRIEFFQVY